MHVKERAEQARAQRFRDNSNFESKHTLLTPKLAHIKEKLVVSGGSNDESDNDKGCQFSNGKQDET